jgi:hypothetical protein
MTHLIGPCMNWRGRSPLAPFLSVHRLVILTIVYFLRLSLRFLDSLFLEL